MCVLFRTLVRYSDQVDLSHPLSSLIPSLDGAVLAALIDLPDPLPLRRIAALCGRSVSGVRPVLQRLVEHGLARQQHLGSVTLYSANRDHILWPALEIAHTSRERLYAAIAEAVFQWPEKPESVSVFGSVARRESGPDSDLDLLIVWRTAPDPASADAQYSLSLSITTMTGNAVQLYVITMDQLAEHVRQREPIVDEWRAEARPLVGARITQLLREVAAWHRA